MIGDWQLRGSMGEVELAQDVNAEWALGEHFVEMRCVSTLTAPDGSTYEAIYFIGHDRESGQFVMHLLDTSGVTTARHVGLGRLDGGSVDFRFDYPSGPFSNRFTYLAASDEWRHDLVSLASGEPRLFAVKHLRRR